MGFSYLKGKNWTQVTRDERFFCQRLYELVRSAPVAEFAQYLSGRLDLNLPADGEWEVGYEVCFYRDLCHFRGRGDQPYSPKRTFDLCFFAESAIVIIEAKAAGGFENDQNEVFMRDIDEVRRLTKVDNVQLVGLCSSKYQTDQSSRETFGSAVIHWKELAARYGNDEILNRADDIYKKNKAFSRRGHNSDRKLSGAELVEAFQAGAEWWVGRGGGISGSRFLADIQTGRWKSQKYEVNTKTDTPPSPNFFALAQFVQAVGEGERLS